MASHKEELRERLKITRQQMPQGKVNTLSDRIIDRVIELVDWSEVLSMHVYLPLTKFHEVDTSKLVNYVRSHYPGIAIATWRKTDQSHAAYWLANEKPVPRNFQYDVILVPLLGFNDQGHRMGFGGGFYDRFLKGQRQAQTIGLGYADSQVQFEAEPHDVPLGFVVTDENTYFRQ